MKDKQSSFNKVILTGKLASVPEIRYTTSDIPVARSAIIISDFNDSGQEFKTYVNFALYGKQAKMLELCATAETPIMIEGRLTSRSWQKDGEKRYIIEIKADNLQLL